MANAKEIKERMASIEETRKITNAMYLISSSKMKQAKKKLADTEPFFYAMQQRSPEFCGMCRICTASSLTAVRVSRLRKERLAISLSPQIKDLQEHIIIT